MRAHFGLPSVEAEETEGKPPIHVKFEIPYFTVSGIQVSYSWGRQVFSTSDYIARDRKYKIIKGKTDDVATFHSRTFYWNDNHIHSRKIIHLQSHHSLYKARSVDKSFDEIGGR